MSVLIDFNREQPFHKLAVGNPFLLDKLTLCMKIELAEIESGKANAICLLTGKAIWVGADSDIVPVSINIKVQ